MSSTCVGERQPFLYYGGSIRSGGSLKNVWYRLPVKSLSQLRSTDAPRKSKKQRRFMESQKENPQESCRVLLDPVFEVESCYNGCSTIIGENIYWLAENPIMCSRELFKHACNDTNPSSWHFLASNKGSFTRFSQLSLIPIARKLYALDGMNTSIPPNGSAVIMGAIYDLDSGTWEDLICDFSTTIAIGPYEAPFVGYSEKTNEILFYSLREGSILFLNLTTGKWLSQNHARFLALWNRDFDWDLLVSHMGMKDCNFLTLQAAIFFPAVFSDDTLYWFTSDLCLYGYDIRLRRWFRSPFLGEKFPTLSPFNLINGGINNGLFPVLVDLHQGKFMVLISEDLGRVIMARLSVSRNENSLCVTVESVIPLSLHHTFSPIPHLSMIHELCEECYR